MANGFIRIVKRNIISQLFILSTILTSGLVMNVIQLLLHILIKPFNKRLFHTLMYYANWTWLSQCVFIADYWSNSELIIHCKKETLDKVGKEHHFGLMNHCYEIDWLIAWLLLEKFECLGSGKGFVKNVIKYIPICGWFFWLSEHIFLQRSFVKDKDKIEERMNDILQYSDNSCTVMTAEGTRFTKEKHEASVVAHVYIERIPISEVEPTQDYLNKLYQKKDELQESFFKYGKFCEGIKQTPIEGIRIKPRFYVAVNTFLWSALNLSFIIYHVTRMILAGQFIYLVLISGGVFGLFYMMMQNIISHSKVKKGSNYGKN
ncbi:CLUMA_CG017100, isoform A [Clunio marinus]|uniref:CLUMA_CG017100, isoform A n=1 Tax=Clunio marinus TaxID=568069 RepID=A0A1J1IUT6_9DIPT|nr:CLUMA_CG017100, isoform A [Clunio marinus]